MDETGHADEKLVAAAAAAECDSGRQCGGGRIFRKVGAISEKQSVTSEKMDVEVLPASVAAKTAARHPLPSSSVTITPILGARPMPLAGASKRKSATPTRTATAASASAAAAVQMEPVDLSVRHDSDDDDKADEVGIIHTEYDAQDWKTQILISVIKHFFPI